MVVLSYVQNMLAQRYIKLISPKH